jgi:hypothetical protein
MLMFSPLILILMPPLRYFHYAYFDITPLADIFTPFSSPSFSLILSRRYFLRYEEHAHAQKCHFHYIDIPPDAITPDALRHAASRHLTPACRNAPC